MEEFMKKYLKSQASLYTNNLPLSLSELTYIKTYIKYGVNSLRLVGLQIN